MGMGTGGIPTTDNIPATTDFLKHLILSYSLKIKLNTCKNNSIQYILKQRVNQNVRYICKIKCKF